MGGKTKIQRTKNNAKPSNSGRSAELLGATVPAFVGFSAHSDFGIIPFVPGFSMSEKLPDSFDSSINPQFHMVMRKMSKKDSVTKVKALQELKELITGAEVEAVKSILHFWPKFYHNLANDIDHRVREAAQEVQSVIVSKCKKALAPYLKQLTPTWIASQYDNYPPAASVSYSSFQTAFAANKTQEVCIFCQTEIVDYVVRNITFHTAMTLSNTKSCTPEEAEQKYQRVVSSSLKMLAFFLEKTAGADISVVEEKIKDLLNHQKFWSLAKYRAPQPKSAWFELVYSILQHCPDKILPVKTKLLPICFQNIDEKDPLVAPHIWGCILLLQETCADWSANINFNKNVQTKLSSILRGCCNGNAEIICPNLLPFISKLSQENINDGDLEDFYKTFFGDIKLSFTTTKSISKSDCSAITTAYFECLRYLIQKYNETNTESTAILANYFLDEFLIEPIKWSLTNDVNPVKYIFQHSAALVVYWAEHYKSNLYSQLLEKFWGKIFQIITCISNKEINEPYLNRAIELINNLYFAKPSLQDQKVKFIDNIGEHGKEEFTKIQEYGDNFSVIESPASYIQTDLRNLVIQLIRLCIDGIKIKKSLNFVSQIRKLAKMFSDIDLYTKISPDNDVIDTLHTFVDFIDNADYAPSEVVVDIIFEILNLLDSQKRIDYINNRLLKIQQPVVQQWVLQRLLSYPMCIEPEARTLLSQKHVIEILLRIAKEVIADNSKEKLNLLHKCFFQIETGDILINPETVDGILSILSQPLSVVGMEHAMDFCGSFLAQIMPIVCSKNSSKAAQNEIFLKLFKFTIDMTISENLSEDTLWEITTCWQDALSSKDIIMDNDLLLQCSAVVTNRLNTPSLSINRIDNIANLMAKLILCSTENIECQQDRYAKVDSTMIVLFKTNDEAKNIESEFEIKSLHDFCTFLEAIQSLVSISCPTHGLVHTCTKDVKLDLIFRWCLLNFSTILNLVCNVGGNSLNMQTEETNDNDECTEDYFDPNENLLKVWSNQLYNLILEIINIAAAGESLINNWTRINLELKTVILHLSEKIKFFLQHCNEQFITELKTRMLSNCSGNDIASCRSLLYLVSINQYEQFEENALIILAEDLTEYFLSRKLFSGYVNTLQYLMPKLSARTITAQSSILNAKPNDKTFWHNAAVFRCLIINNFTNNYNEISDKSIIIQTLQFISEISEKQHTKNDLLLYNLDIKNVDFIEVTNIVEYINLLNEVISKFGHEMTVKNWDVIRIGLSSWVLSVSKSIDYFTNPKVSIFVAAIYRLYASLAVFIKDEKERSSTQFLKTIIDEWENLFAREINIILFKTFYNLVQSEVKPDYLTCFTTLLNEMSPSIELLDFSFVFNFCKDSSKITLDDLLNFLLTNLFNKIHSIRTVCMHILKQLTNFFIAADIETYDKRNSIVGRSVDDIDVTFTNWHFLSKFGDYIGHYEKPIIKYIDEFSFKLTELQNFKQIERGEALSYLFLWDCITYVCSHSPVELRSLYTAWLNENKYEQNLLNFLFRAMPVEILKNHDSKIMNNDIFKGLTWAQIKDPNFVLEKYVCHMYSEVLRKLPAVVRKWWNGSSSRRKTFVDKLTTNFVSTLICQEELKAIINKKERHENMQVTVHTSTREVLAIYSIDEARMELVITLAPNYPLGAVKVESGKQIGGKASSRNIGMQLTIFLTHQNGSIFDGLSLWKKNLDKKFEGVEECYVCYTVIHQDTCQLPKLTCKTCKKKFHGPCLYKWFTTSSKSTCPICRNVF